jgi:hypothetical protein
LHPPSCVGADPGTLRRCGRCPGVSNETECSRETPPGVPADQRRRPGGLPLVAPASAPRPARAWADRGS